MDSISNILSSFDSISLEEMDAVKLMDRKDTKYLLTFQNLPEILEAIKPYYRVLDVNNNRIIRYESLYFDTPDFDLYNQHQTGRLNRYKIRYRKYVDSNLVFFEIKFKNNKNRTVKNRIRQSEILSELNDTSGKFLLEKTTLLPQNLSSKMWVNFSRFTLVNRNSPERVTIDMNLAFKKEGLEKKMEGLIIAEVKQDKSIRSAFIKEMKSRHIQPGSISKYCFAVLSLFNTQRHNNFKPQLILINKLLHAPSTSA